MEFGTLAQVGLNLAITYVPKLLLAVVTFIIGLWIIRFITRVLEKGMTRTGIDVSLQRFFGSMVAVLLKVLLLISVASMIGIATTSFVAILGAAGLAVGLALQGSLANFAGGVLVLMFKPYKLGDFIQAQDVSGSVKEIQVFNTVLTTPDNKTVIIPNGAISNGIITNYSTQNRRRVDMTFGIGYSDDITKAKSVLNKLIAADERIFAEPAPQVVVSELADSSVNFAVRVWSKSSDYWGIYFDMQEKVKLTFDEESISIPFPQQDVHVYNQTGN